MKAVFERAKVIVDGEDTFLCLSVPYYEARKFIGEMKDKKYSLEIKEYREKRSLDANAYLWVLLDKMAAAKTRMDRVACVKEDLYVDYVRDCGPFKDFELSMDEAKTFETAWHMLGTGWPTEKVDFTPDGERVTIRAYYGSSTYNTKQMSRLLDLVVQDARALGVETMTPEELESLLEGER